MMVNQGILGFESPIWHITITLMFIKGPQVDGGVKGILEGLEQLHLIANNIEYTYINFLACFDAQFTDSMQQEVTQASLDRLMF